MDLRQQINALPKLKKSLSCLRREFDSLEYIESLTDFQFDISDNLILNYVDQEGNAQNLSINLSALRVPNFRPDIVVENFDELLTVTGQSLFEFALVENSQGFRWLPGSLLGTYYGSGLYYWNGTEWINDDDKIYEAFQDFTDGIALLQTNLAQEITDRTSADNALQSQITININDITDLQNNKADINHTHVKADITDFNDADYATAAQGATADTALQPGDNISELNNDAGYITSFVETDPIFSASPAFGITTGNISNWNTAFSWGDHATAGYLTTIPAIYLQTGNNVSELVNDAGYLTNETDPVFQASPAAGIAVGDINNWNTAFSWGDHATQGYLTSFTETDPVFQASEAANFVAGDKANLDNQSGVNTGDQNANQVPLAPTVGGSANVQVAFEDHESRIGANEAEITTLEAVDIALNNAITQEIADRIAGDNSLAAQIAQEIIDRVAAGQALQDQIPFISMIKYSNTDTTTNINLSTATTFPTDVPIFGALQDSKTPSDFTVVGNTVAFNFTGYVEGYVSVHIFSTGQRNSIQIRRKINGVPEGPISSSGYIRATSGHNEASLNIPIALNVTQGQTLSIGTKREGTNATATFLSDVGTSEIYLTRKI